MNSNDAVNLPQEPRAEFVGRIILLAREIEQQLHLLCNSDAAGIHNLTELAGEQLGSHTRRRLHYIAAIRNQAAHEADFSLSRDEFENYCACVEQVKNELAQLTGHISPDKNEPEPVEELNLEVERELWKSINRKLALLGYLPGAGMIYSAYLLFLALFGQLFTVLGMIIYVCSVILMIKGFYQDKTLMYVAIFFLATVYIAVAVMALKNPPVRKIPGIIWLLPGINAIALLLRWIKYMPWGKLLLSSASIACFAGGIILLTCRAGSWGALLLAASYAGSISSAVMWGKERDE